jgi:hypothetical protein
LKKLQTLLSVSLFCGLNSISFAASAPPPASNQLTNQAMAGLQKNPVATGPSAANNKPKVKPGAAPTTKNTFKTNLPLSPKTQILVKTYQADIQKRIKDDTQYQKDVTATSTLMGQIKNNKPTLEQAQALLKLQARITAEKTRYETDKQKVAKDMIGAKAAMAALKTDQAKGQPAAGKASTSSSQAQNKTGATAPVASTSQNSTSKTQTNSSSPGFDIQALTQIVNGASAAATAHLSAINAQTQNVSIGDMFNMQMMMNHLSQLSEMSTAVVNASNSSIQSMARNVK